MNVGEIVKRVQRQIGDEENIIISIDDIIRWANDGQIDIARKTKCLQGFITIDSETDVSIYDLPQDFLSLDRVTFDGLPVEKLNQAELDQLLPSRDTVSGGQSGPPKKVWIWGNQLNFWPTPSSDGTDNIKVFYIHRPDILIDSEDTPSIPVQMHRDLYRYCLSQAKELLEEDGEAERIRGEYEAQVVLSTGEINDANSDSFPAIRCLPGDY